jgi:lysophospholipase L1-like esterase
MMKSAPVVATIATIASSLIVSALSVAVGLAEVPAASQAAPAPAAATAAPATPQNNATAPLPPALTSCPELAAVVRTVAANDARNRDWPNLARYREANRSVGPVDVVFMGDSITDAWAQPRFADSFFPGKRYAGRGISGQTTPQMVLRFRQDVLALKPKVVVILAGTNDIAGNTGPMSDEEIEGNLETMGELAAASGVKVIFSSILPTSAYHVANPNAAPQTSLRPLSRIRAVNDWMKSYAAAHNQYYLDYYAAMIDAQGMLKSELSADDLHPTAPGYAIMAPLAQAAIDKALAR